MAVGLPTVAFDTPVAREYLGTDGALAVPGDVESLAGKLLTYLSLIDAAPDQLRNTGQRLRQRAVQHFSWDSASRLIVQAYQDLLGGTPAAAETTTSCPAAHR